MPTPESVQAVVGASLDTWKRQLLDLTRRNRALNFRPLKVSTIAIVDEQPAELFRLLYDEERALRFAAAAPTPAASAGNGPGQQCVASADAEDPDAFEQEEHASHARSFEPYATDSLPAAHIDLVLQTSLAPDALDRSLRRIEEQARVSIEEQGVNTLFLALGLLHYTEAEASDEVFRAPVVLLPVTLRRESARSPFVLEVGDDEPMVNPALAELVRRQFNISLPDLPAEEGASLQSIFVQLQGRLSTVPAAQAEPRWKVTTDVYLGLFSFQKLVMYKDLEATAAAVTQHRLVTQLITRRGSVQGGGLGLPDDIRTARLDDVWPPESGAHVVDADGSQQRALAAVERGHDLVVEGPPGTGKSQTITNLVAQALHAGKSVLFVAEKMAALDVVHQRLQRAGLGEFCLELHSTRSSKREVIRSVAAALDASLDPLQPPADVAARLRDVRFTLGAYVAAVHEPFGRVQVSPYAAYGELARVIDAPRVDWPGDAEATSREDLERAKGALEALAAASEAAGDRATHPWRDTARTFYPQDRLDAIIETSAEVGRRVPEVQALAAIAATTTGVPALGSLADVARVTTVADLLRRSPGAPRDVLESAEWDRVPPDARALIDAVREVQRLRAHVGARFTPEAIQGDHAADIAYIESASGVLGTLFWWLDGRQRAIRKRWATYKVPAYSASIAEQAHDMTSITAFHVARQALRERESAGVATFGAHWHGADSDAAQLETYANWVTEFRQALVRESLVPRAVEVASLGAPDLTSVTRLLEAASELSAVVDRLIALVQWRTDATSLAAMPLADLRGRAEGLAAQAGRAARWGALVAAEHDVRETIAMPLLPLVETGRVVATDLTRAFLRAFWFAWLARAVESRPALARFQALTHDQRVREFQDLDRRVIEDNRVRLTASLRARVQGRLREPQVEAAMPVLRREMAKQRNHRPIRETLRHADAAVRAIKPVFLMSPLSVAQFTAGGAPSFDVVIFDEASQLPPEDAVGSIARGRQLVVVGDPKQLPPTSFFAAHQEVPPSVDSDDGVEVPDAESILEAFMGCGVPMSRLKWHYRSAHESLISFSNVSFYDGDLLTFPSVEPVSDRLGLRFEHVASGIYEGKGLNLAEARRVADAVVAFAREQLAIEGAGRRPLSLGVGTFNLRQQLAIQDLLEEKRRDEPAIDAFFDRSRDEPFFVKNLENIQGDERDVIFLSVTYAKGRDGRLRQNFGPLNGENGWRRLNVLTTRARRAMRVFSSMRAFEIQEGQSRGGPLLKAFLDYAESGRLDHPLVAAAASAESPFEREVVSALSRRGHDVQPQVGVAGYRIDIGVRDPDAPGRFLLGIECDGVAYHSSDTARDRDRLRQQVLETRGWTILRLWSTDWFKDRQGQMERIEQAIANAHAAATATRASEAALQALAAPAEVPADSIKVSHPPAPALPSTTAEPSAAEQPTMPYTHAGRPARVAGQGVLECPIADLVSIVKAVVDVESPVHEDDVIARVASFWGQRSGARIRMHVLTASREAAKRGLLVHRDEFVYAPHGCCVARDRSETGIAADRIAPEEYDAALLAVLAGERTVRRDALLAEARRRLGFERTGSTLSAALDAAVNRLLARGAIGEGSGGYRLRQ